MEKIRILIAEDEGLLRVTLAELLGRETDLAVVAACANGRDALIEALHHRPDVVLTDLRMPRMDGIELTRELKEKLPQTAVVVLTAFDDDEHLFAALKAGATGYVLKDASPSQIVEALHAVRRGEGFLSPGLVTRVLAEFNRTDRMVRGQREIFAQLTRRETEVLFWLAQGKTNAGIGTTLGLSRFTVRTHLEHIYQKLGVQTRTAAAALAYGENLKPGIGELPSN